MTQPRFVICFTQQTIVFCVTQQAIFSPANRFGWLAATWCWKRFFCRFGEPVLGYPPLMYGFRKKVFDTVVRPLLQMFFLKEETLAFQMNFPTWYVSESCNITMPTLHFTRTTLVFLHWPHQSQAAIYIFWALHVFLVCTANQRSGKCNWKWQEFTYSAQPSQCNWKWEGAQ